LDSPAVLSTAGTVAIHIIIAVCGDALVVMNPPEMRNKTPVVELIDIEPPPILKPPPPPVPDKQPETKPDPVPQPKVQKVVQRREEPPPPKHDDPPPQAEPSGGAPVTTMDNVAPSATGVAVATGVRSTGKIGRGGIGTGTGAGTGSGTAEVAPPPVSVATIKTRAMPRGDFSYFDASKDYPAEAKTLGIEGIIRVRLVVDAKGKVTSTTLLNKLGHGLDELALKRAQAIEFNPAKDSNDQPVTSVVVWTFNMTLPK
jgi:protein TonB